MITAEDNIKLILDPARLEKALELTRQMEAHFAGAEMIVICHATTMLACRVMKRAPKGPIRDMVLDLHCSIVEGYAEGVE